MWLILFSLTGLLAMIGSLIMPANVDADINSSEESGVLLLGQALQCNGPSFGSRGLSKSWHTSLVLLILEFWVRR